MRTVIKKRLLFLVSISIVLLGIATSGTAIGGCIPVAGNRILGRDLALADARFSALPATLIVGFAPAPGTKRTYVAAELQRLARSNGISVDSFEDICFELAMLHLTEEDATTAMRRSLPADAVLKIVELANFDVPAGRLEFPIEGLEPLGALNHGVQLWHGHVKYAETRQLSFWARVEVTVKFTAVFADKDLAIGVPIAAGSLRIETRIGPLERELAATRIEDVQGRVPKRELKNGSAIPIALLVEAPTVRKGDPVAVEVHSGLASLRFEAIAENAARDGEIVELRNPSSGKTFKARLDPRGLCDKCARAVVIVAAGQKL